MSFYTRSLHSRNALNLDESPGLLIPHFHIHECGFVENFGGWNYRNTISSFWSLWHFKNEGGWIENGNEHWKLGPECLVLSPPHIIISLRSNCPVSQLWLHFTITPGYAFDANTPFSIPLDVLLKKQVSAVQKAHQKDPLVLNHLALSLLHTCFARHPLQQRALPEEVKVLLQRIDDNPGSDLSNSSLASLVGMSVSNFINWFEVHMSQSPGAYVREVRYQKACRMLIFSELTIKQISAKLGYPNRDYFSRVFAKYAGCGPAQYRKRHMVSQSSANTDTT